jgi:26S proteasome regulatory subunit N13
VQGIKIRNVLFAGPGFSELLKPDIVVPLLENLQLEERLAPYLPEGVQSKQAIAELMQSPQFHQQLDSFTQVLRSGQMDLSQFGIDPSKCEALYDLCQQGE